jgi:hypothetical protein
MQPQPQTIPQPYSGGVPYNSVADLQWQENLRETRANSQVLQLTVPLDLVRRKIYAWLYVSPSNSADYFCDCRINFFRGTSPAGYLPLRVGISNGTANTVVPNSLVSAFTSAGTANADSLGVFVGNQQGSEPNSLSLQPLYIYGLFDRAVLECKELKNVTYFRTFAGIISSL